MSSSIKSRLFLWFILVSVIPLIVIGSFSYYLIFNKIEKLNEENITNINKGIYNMVDTQQKVLSRLLESAAISFSNKLKTLGNSNLNFDNTTNIGNNYLPTWYIGKQKITGDFSLVDELIDNEKLPATIFQFHNNKFIRVSTNVRQPDGSRIIGTIIDSGPIYEKLLSGQKYLGPSNVEGIWHVTIYQPIWDTEGKIIGAFVLGRREEEYELINTIKNIVVGDTGYVYVMDKSGNAIIHPTKKGQNLLEYDSVKEILEKKNGSVTYDFYGKRKIAYFTYFEPWNWYIVTSSYVSEVFNTTSKLSQILLVAIIVVIGISAWIAFILSNTFSKPINELMLVMRRAQSGDLSMRLPHFNHDEFKILCDAFSTMLNNMSLLIGRIISNSNKLKEASQRLLIDLTESKKSLKGIEIGVEKLQLYSTPYSTNHSHNNILNINEDFQQKISQVKHMIAQANLNKQKDDYLEKILNNLDELEQFYNEYISCIVINNQPITNINKINNLQVEVQKLKLLLKNISSSGSILDDIALSLDRHVKVFKIEKDTIE